MEHVSGQSDLLKTMGLRSARKEPTSIRDVFPGGVVGARIVDRLMQNERVK